MEIPVGLIHYMETRVDGFSDTLPRPLSVKSWRFVSSGLLENLPLYPFIPKIVVEVYLDQLNSVGFAQSALALVPLARPRQPFSPTKKPDLQSVLFPLILNCHVPAGYPDIQVLPS